jgi:hypothetical protein
VAIVIALLAWGSVSALSWLVAALATQALSALHEATHAATSESSVEHMLVAIAASICIALVARYAPRPSPTIPEPPELILVDASAHSKQAVAVVAHENEPTTG